MEDIYYNVERCFHKGVITTRYQNAIDRLIKGPLDVCGGDGLHPSFIIAYVDKFYLLEVEDWTTRPSTSTYVGYAEVTKYRETDTADYKACIKRIEIFREHRGKGYGTEFAKKLVQPSKYMTEDVYGVEINDMDASIFVFWWRAVKEAIVDDLVESITEMGEEESVEKQRENLNKYMKEVYHDKTVTRILTSLGNYIIDNPEWIIEDAYSHVENLDDYKKCVEHVENTRCHLCYSFFPKLRLTCCGGNCHEEKCKYNLMCDTCCDKLIEVDGECPGRCCDGKIGKLMDEYVYSIE